MFHALWPDLANFCILGNHSKLLAKIILPKSPKLLGNFCKGVKIILFLVNSFLGKFYRHLAIFIWSHWFHVLWLLFTNQSAITVMLHTVSFLMTLIRRNHSYRLQYIGSWTKKIIWISLTKETKTKEMIFDQFLNSARISSARPGPATGCGNVDKNDRK